MEYKQARQHRYMLILTLLSIISVIAFLGLSLFNTKGEPREAVVALSMINTGDWISPVNNGVDIAYKPPFFHWCIALISLLLGGVTEFTSRLPSALAMIAMLLVVFHYQVKNKVEVKVAFLSALVTLTTFEVHRGAMACRVDMMLSVFIVISIYLLHDWYVSRKHTSLLLAILCMSCGFLTKGPVGVVLPCLVAGVYMLLRGEKFFKTLIIFIAVGTASCVLPAVWYYLAYLERGDSFLYLVYEENILRFTGKMVYSSHEEPAIYNILTLISGLLPYTVLLLISLFALKYRKPRMEWGSTLWVKLKDRISSMNSNDLLSLLAFVLIFVFYCIPKSKRSVYLLPVYPFAAYFIARYMLYLANRHRKIVSGFGWFISILALLIPILYLIINLGLIPQTIFHGKHAADNIAYLNGLSSAGWGIPAIISVIVILGSIAWFWARGRKQSAYTLCLSSVSIVYTIMFCLDGMILPPVLNSKSDKDVAHEIATILPADDVLWDYRKDDRPEARNMMRQFSINFYLGDRVRPFYSSHPASGYLIMGDDDAEAFGKSYADYELTKIKYIDHKSCDDKRRLTLYSFKRN